MPGGGQIGIVAFGNQNLFFNGNPDFTYFYKVYRRFTHFSQESVVITLDGPNQLLLDSPIMLRAKIPRNADLLTDLVLTLTLPDMYSGIAGRYTPSFRWIHMLGAFMIQNLSIFVGGSQIQSFPGDWIAARATMDMPLDRYLKWRSMVGDVPELNEPEWGIRGKSPNYPYAGGEYPHNLLDPSGNPTAPSVYGRQLRVPLPFWFTESWGTSLPLVALQMHEVEIQIQLRPLREIYRLFDPVFNTEPVRANRKLLNNPAYPTTTDVSLPGPPYDNLTLQANYQSWNDLSGSPRFFYTQAGDNVPRQDGFIMNAQLEGNYIYLTEKEQVAFVQPALTHLVHQVQTFTFPSITGLTRLDLDVHGLMTRLVFFGRRTDAIESRNDFINLSNWKYLNQAPYWPMPSPTLPVPNSGLLVSYAQRDILKSARLLLAGNELQESRPAAYFEVQTAFQNTVGSGAAGLHPGSLKPDDVMGPIYQMTFALNASDHVQPSGTLNTSRIREVQLEVVPWDLDPYSPFAFDFTVFCETLNTVKFMNGMAGLGFAI